MGGGCRLLFRFVDQSAGAAAQRHANRYSRLKLQRYGVGSP